MLIRNKGWIWEDLEKHKSMSTSISSFVNVENYKKRSPNVALSYIPGTKSCRVGVDIFLVIYYLA